MHEATPVGASAGVGEDTFQDGVLPSQALEEAIAADWVSSGDYRIRPEAIQPASIDLRLDRAAQATARSAEQVVDVLRYVIAGKLP
jgi:deoxycytidine triphosphate deaminase